MRKWVRNVTGRYTPPTHPLHPGCGQTRPEPALESESLLLWFPGFIGGRLPGNPEGCFSVTLWEEKLSCLSNRVWLGCNDTVNVLGEPGREEAAVALGSGLTSLLNQT